jgi:PKD repeat protein
LTWLEETGHKIKDIKQSNMKKAHYLIFSSMLLLGLVSCKKEEPVLIDPPTEADAQFNYEPSFDNPNIIEFTAVNGELTANWDFGNGTTGTGTSVTSSYPYAGTYTVTLTVFNQGGSATSSQEIVIANDDPTLLDDPLYNLLTGGLAGSGSRVWVIDSTTVGHFGVGPDPVSDLGDVPEWYAANPLDKAGAGMYDDRYEFYLNAFQFDMITNGNVYIDDLLAGSFPDSYENLGDYTAPFPDQLNETWTLTVDEDTTLTLSGSSFIGFWTGVQTYRILSIDDTSMILQYKDQAGGLHWYLKLIPEGFVHTGGGGGEEPTTYSLPLDFEGEVPVFTTFGGSTYSVIANPDPSGINTSANVAETIHGVETWAGLFVDLTDPLDFSTNTIIKLKVWAPVAGPFRFKIENSDDTGDFVEIDANVTTAGVWEEVFVDFAGTTSGVYDRLVIFPGWSVSSAGTFYIDDIEQE